MKKNVVKNFLYIIKKLKNKKIYQMNTIQLKIMMKIFPCHFLYNNGEISRKLYNCLKELGLNNIKDTLNLKPFQIIEEKKSGRKTLYELQKCRKV